MSGKLIINLDKNKSKYVIMSNITYSYDEKDYNTNILWKSYITYDNSFLIDDTIPTKLDVRIPKQNHSHAYKPDNGYEGATVFPPTSGTYEDPIFVKDYASLYPSSMIHRNLSHECYVDIDGKYDNLPGYNYVNVTYTDSDGSQVKCRYAQKTDGSIGIIPTILKHLLDARKATKKDMKNESDPFKKSILDGLQLAYKVTANSLYGQIGAPVSQIYFKDIAASTTATGRDMLTYAKEFTECILSKLINLIQRNKHKSYKEYMKRLFDGELYDLEISDNFRDLIEKAPDLVRKYQFRFDKDDFMKFFTDNEETFKTEVPSFWEYYTKMVDPKDNKSIDKFVLYLDENFDKLFEDNQDIGQEVLHKLDVIKNNFIKNFKQRVIEILGKYKVNPVTIYGDTDSIFVNPNITKYGEKQTDFNALKMAIEFGVLSGNLINKFMPYPHDLEYEKTFWPFVILTKKRYVGNLYEEDPNKSKQKSMGIVLKRRDNSPIVKIVCGGIVKSILNEKSISKAIDFTKIVLSDILCGKYPLEKFVITKTLSGSYADRSRIVHAVLADRIAERDPGNKPQSNDRIPYAYIRVDKEVELQGDRVEHPQFIIDNNLQLDYLFYITNQIMKPACDFLGTMTKDPHNIFEEYITMEINRRKGKKPIEYYFENTDDSDNEIFDFERIPIKQEKKKTKTKTKTKKKKTSKHVNLNVIETTDGFLIDI